MRTFIEREFAGEMRRFELRNPRLGSAHQSFEGPFGNLAELVQRARTQTLGAGAARHVILYGLVGGKLGSHSIDFVPLVDAEMEGKPLTQFSGLATEIIAAAFAGVPDDEEAEAA